MHYLMCFFYVEVLRITNVVNAVTVSVATKQDRKNKFS